MSSSKERVLVVGMDARTDATCFLLSQSPQKPKVLCAPGNPGTERWAENIPLGEYDFMSHVKYGEDQGVGLTIYTTEEQLVRGGVDAHLHWGRKAFGPTALNARWEGSKVWSYDRMQKMGLPIPDSVVVQNRDQGIAAALDLGMLQDGVALRPNGLTAGKGVKIVRTLEEAERAYHQYFEERRYGAAGLKIQVSRFIKGREASIIALTDGENIVLKPVAVDQKRKKRDDPKSPMTGGMKVFTRPTYVTEEMALNVRDGVMKPIIISCREETGIPYRGVIYVGIMVTPDGKYKILEINVRDGNPEKLAQAPLFLGDYFQVCHDTASGRLDPSSVRWKDLYSCDTEVVSENYAEEEVPPDPKITRPINLSQLEGGELIFYGGVVRGADNQLAAQVGKRAVGAVALGRSRKEAVQNSEDIARKIIFDGAEFSEGIPEDQLN